MQMIPLTAENEEELKNLLISMKEKKNMWKRCEKDDLMDKEAMLHIHNGILLSH